MRIIFLVMTLCVLFNNIAVADDHKVAVRAYQGIEYAISHWGPTVKLLEKKIPGHTFTLVPIVSLKEVIVRAGNNEFDFVITNPSSFVEIEQLFGARPLATLNNRRADTAQDRFGSVIFTHVKNNDILKIKDLEGKSLMVVSERAFGGWQVAWLEMLEQGFNPQKLLKNLMFTKSNTQPEVVQAVLDGKADAGVVRTDLLERMEAAGKVDMRYLRIINNKDIKGFPFFISTKLYPEWAFAAMNSVPVELSQQVKKILFAVDPDSEAARKGQYVGWLPPRDYSTVRALLKTLKIQPGLQ